MATKLLLTLAAFLGIYTTWTVWDDYKDRAWMKAARVVFWVGVGVMVVSYYGVRQGV